MREVNVLKCKTRITDIQNYNTVHCFSERITEECIKRDATWITDDLLEFDTRNYYSITSNTIMATDFESDVLYYTAHLKPDIPQAIYLHDWFHDDDTPEASDLAMTKLALALKQVDYLLVKCIKIDATENNSTTTSYYFPAPKNWATHNEFLVWARSCNSTLKIIASVQFDTLWDPTSNEIIPSTKKLYDILRNPDDYTASTNICGGSRLDWCTSHCTSETMGEGLCSLWCKCPPPTPAPGPPSPAPTPPPVLPV